MKGFLMNITGIIAEYNPFHNGHAFHISCARNETDADCIIAVMSGNFVQRGAPALADKFTRARMALAAGADLVVELPPLWSCASAEYFAGAGVSLLEQLGCVRFLCYGCETPDSGLSARINGILSSEPPQYRRLLNNALKQGCCYAAAREKAVMELLPESDRADAAAVLKNPNNILALEYQKAIAAISSSMKTHPVLRKDQGYHSDSLSDHFASASAIRRFLCKQPDLSGQKSLIGQTLSRVIPDAAFQLLWNYQSQYPFLYEDDCSQMLHYCLLKNADDGFSDYADCTPDFSNKLCRSISDYTRFSDFCALLKTKNMAYTRISRILVHILLDIRHDDYAYWRSRSFVPYARILGFRKESGALGYIKKHASIPLLTRAADAKKILSKDALVFFQKHLFADSVYRALVAGKGGQAVKNEFQQQIAVYGHNSCGRTLPPAAKSVRT